jgi:hypothetical protein
MIPADQINGGQIPVVLFRREESCGCGWIDGYLIGWLFGAAIAYFTWGNVLKNR